MTIKVNGTVTEVKSVEVDISIVELEKAANQLTNGQLLIILKRKLVQQLISKDPALQGAELSWHGTCWEVFDYYDYHHREDKYKKLRDLNDEEKYALSTFNDVFELFRKLQ
ncbi:hypothetical protein pEaSNUABM50_00403 [Erwinia phage pEa_SNUABM_50]|uniref:Uncharacterized protein n=4 Tax=Eneladusvirus BF TaxID=2560751 RepID=A0A7L8ZN46_9CAUD|nr:hypothetical protein FDH34_gp517 [Serratia phage BF]QOI71342.1 hypothetical protein pEaSNUABM12_00409 [Erwinia phage pEa_SNUABM_12]QOI71884.1 hypothetical protein pEaSNUABM47_00405 [Erwinia phage pEa_SNUABM_47]QOI72423.1 hypothetical protein pEaSNUABM50_00403 [Erwinia phage pEa_SNUABM_50]QXO11550.1 hypothetical protein pEaSNUABM19_00409 [Erwinia phage pEa_SNUABM_19]QXO12098.1 hypothetical protein pEaSNUABM44_00407 [Erwinia phage pEa_SNUABM_44]QXO12651.1 hypothetical protein pEaSNUABM49_004